MKTLVHTSQKVKCIFNRLGLYLDIYDSMLLIIRLVGLHDTRHNETLLNYK